MVIVAWTVAYYRNHIRLWSPEHNCRHHDGMAFYGCFAQDRKWSVGEIFRPPLRSRCLCTSHIVTWWSVSGSVVLISLNWSNFALHLKTLRILPSYSLWQVSRLWIWLLILFHISDFCSLIDTLISIAVSQLLFNLNRVTAVDNMYELYMYIHVCYKVAKCQKSRKPLWYFVELLEPAL